MNGRWSLAAVLLLLVALVALVVFNSGDARQSAPAGRSEVLFWHFWGGEERKVVEAIVDRFNTSQQTHFVRAIAMPGKNLELKFFLASTGGNPPDLLNQGTPVVADWAQRGVLTPIRELTSPEEYSALETWLIPAARGVGSYRGELYALCNGLDVRALYYDQTVLDQFGLTPPQTIEELDRLARTIAPPEERNIRRFGYLPDPRRIWAWGIVFGGQFYDAQRDQITADSEPIVRALRWMSSYSKLYGSERVAAFRAGDQQLPGAAFPLLEGRYAAIMDGQWRVPQIVAHQQAARRRGETPHQYGVVPLPVPPGGRQRAGWLNGNFFVVPSGCKNPAGAWEFMKFWSGFGGHEADAAWACSKGAWIPVSEAVVGEPTFQAFLEKYPLFRQFVELSASPNQVPTPPVPAGPFFLDSIINAAQDAMYRDVDSRRALQRAARNVRARLAEVQP